MKKTDSYTHEKQMFSEWWTGEIVGSEYARQRVYVLTKESETQTDHTTDNVTEQ